MLGDGFLELTLDAPGAAVRHAEAALERERVEAVLVPSDPVDALEPAGERQLGGVKQGPGAQGGLGASLRALPVAARIRNETEVLAPTQCGTEKPLRPARPLRGALAMSPMT